MRADEDAKSDPASGPLMDVQDLAFVRHALALKHEVRQGWRRAGITRPESVADHTWGVSLLVLLASRGSDDATARQALEMAILHDVAEAITGDRVPGEYVDRAAKLAAEDEALRTMLAGVSPATRAHVRALLDELEAQDSAAARLVKAADKAEMGLMADLYEHAGRAPAAALAEFRDSAKRGVRGSAFAAFWQ